MKKNFILALPCIAAVAFATFVGKKALEASAYESNSLLMQNVEALTQNEEDISDETKKRRQDCFDEGGQWGYASVYVGTVTLNHKTGLIYTHNGKEYSISYEKSGGQKRLILTQYQCVADSPNISVNDKNCCKKQGLFLGDEKIG